MRKRKIVGTVLCLAALVALAGCESRTDRSEGGVLLSVSDFDVLPVRVGVNDPDFPGAVQIGSITIQSIPKDQNADTSPLMNVEMSSYQVTYSRFDGGQRVPPPLVEAIFGVTPVNGTNVYDNLVLMGAEQIFNPPISDLLFVNGGIDTETGESVIKIRFRLQFFGRTLTGDPVSTEPVTFDIEFVS